MLTSRRRMTTVMACLAVLVGLLATSGCGGGPAGPAIRTEMVPFTPDQAAEMEQARSDAYRLRPGDQVTLDFKYEDDLDSTQLLILPDGRITLPGGIDPVMARGLTVTELDQALESAYAEDFRNPELSVLIDSLAEMRVYVLGFVKRPGDVEYPPGGMSVLQAIAAAGGFDEDGAASETVILRATPEGFMLRQIDLSHLEKRGIPTILAMDIRPYDVIYVPRTAIGDFAYFSKEFVGSLLNYGDLFWDIYTVANLHKVEGIWRR